MNIYIYKLHTFHCIFILPIQEIKYLDSSFIKIIPIQWQLILMNEGSFTQALLYLTNKPLNIKISQKYSITFDKKYINIRCIWLANSIYTKLIFARSLWQLMYLDQLNSQILKHGPIGISLVESKLNIYKNVHEIYYGYCHYLEWHFKSNKAIWGRKYTIYYNYKSYATIQEFFSPNIINLF